ncbi:MAG: hypothetical protein KKC28_06370 [Verrucomicrobia bacterium]|nr:hypothetical protein [Verrucomicrobiota bacterium]MBU1856591.1 hypothetical protein [Verrucomicrobiota bacterium]
MKKKTTWEYGMQFEFCMRRVFGDDARHIASSCLDGNYRREWVKKLLKQLIRDVQDLDTTQEHRQHVSCFLEGMLKESWTGEEASWRIVFDLFLLLVELMGYCGVRGERTYTPMYWQSLETHLDIGNARGKCEELQREFFSAAKHRAEVVKFLKDKGLTDFEVAMTLKTSEHEVKKLKKGI